jgi:chaperonin GroEL (HSP60 family)
MEVAKKLRSYAVKVSSKEQHAIGAFVDSLETIPENLARNAGLDVTDVKLALRLAHEKEEGSWLGINVLSRKIENTLTCGIIEPYSVKKQVLRTAVEVASTIIRTANIISFHPNEETAPSAPTGDRGA